MDRERHTRHQVPRGTIPDAEKRDAVHLIKNVSLLRATYQVRMLLYMAMKTRRKLIIHLPGRAALASDLEQLRREHPKELIIERME